MCVLFCGLDSTHPTREQLTRANCANPDGFGWAVMRESGDIRTIVTDRGLEGETVLDSFIAELRREPAEVVCWLYHARIATHGDMSAAGLAYNLHPFAVDSETVLAHNGMLPTVQHKDDPRSDTRHLAEVVLPALGGVLSLDIPEVWDMVGEWASGSKVVIMTTSPAASFPLYIINEEDGHWAGSWWASNRSYEPYKPYAANYGARYAYGFDDLEVGAKGFPALFEDYNSDPNCSGCSSVLYADEECCGYCGTCQSCFESWDECLCTPQCAVPSLWKAER